MREFLDWGRGISPRAGGGTFVPVTLNLAQTGNAVNGTINVAGRPDYSGDVTGVVEPFPGVPFNLRRSG
jgi:hypothetical protein